MKMDTEPTLPEPSPGNGTVEPRFAGMAPSVRHIRFAKVLHRQGFGSDNSILPGMDFLAQPTGCAEDGGPSDRAKPLIVNMSLSACARIFQGRRTAERKLDSVVWSHRQLYVVAQSNAGINCFSNYGTAKNSLAVGAVQDSGDIAAFSSHGPTFDGRLAPQVVATGVRVHSARGGGSRGEYVAFNGTSMSSPTVAGVAALLMDAIPGYQEQPALTRARLMASAIRPGRLVGGHRGVPPDQHQRAWDAAGAVRPGHGVGAHQRAQSGSSRRLDQQWGDFRAGSGPIRLARHYGAGGRRAVSTS